VTQQNILTGLIIVIVALIIVAAGILVVLAPAGTGPAPGAALSVPEAPTPDQMKSLAAEIAGQIDGDALAALKPGDENTPAYTAVHDQLNAIRAANPNILYIYTVRKAGDGAEYIVDADYGIGFGAQIGYACNLTDADVAFRAGFAGPSAEPGFYVDEWGDAIYTAISGYAPVRDSSGAIVAMLGVDVGRVITEESLKALAGEIAGQIDGDALAALKPGDENTPAYTAVHDRLSAFRDANPGVLYVYTMRKAGNATEYVVDADYGSSSIHAARVAAGIGKVYVPTEGDALFLAGFTEPSAEREIYTAEWDDVTATVISGYAPVRDSNGTIVGLVGVDIGSEKVIAKTAQKVFTPDEMKALAAEIAGQIDGDAHAALKPGDEKTPAYIAIRDRLDVFRNVNPGVLYVYTMRNAGDITEYVVDADYGSGSYAFAIGDDSTPAKEDPALLAGFTQPASGTYTTVYGYAPIKNSGGAVTGVVCLYVNGPIAQEDLEALAAEIAGQIDGDAHAALKPGDETTPAFTAIRDRLDAFRTANPEIAYIYTMRKAGSATEYVVDADYGSDDSAPAIGIEYIPQDSDTAFLDGFTRPSAAIYITVSGYAPIKGATGGDVTGVVCLDTESLVTPERVKALATEAAALIDGDAIATLKPGDEKTPAFTAIRDRLAAFRDANPGVIYVYTMRNVNGTVEYVVDADYGSVDTPGIGEVCNDTGAAMLAGFKEASAESAFVTEQWGNETATTLSGYAPVKDSTGAVVGLVGVDMGRLW